MWFSLSLVLVAVATGQQRRVASVEIPAECSGCDPAGQPATWTLHASTNCYAGFGAEDLETPRGNPCCKCASIDDCFAQCAATAGCEAVVVTSTSPLLCYRRGYVDLSSCVADVGYDTYIMPSVPPKSDGGGGGDGVQLKAMSFNAIGCNDVDATMPLYTKVWMVGRGLIGTLPSQLTTLTRLSEIDASGNQISGTLPSQLMNLTSLSLLGLAFNAISGTLPSQPANSGLIQLGLHTNQLSGTLPSQLADLVHLSLSENRALSGTLPSQIAHLTRLRLLMLDATALSGTLPPQLRDMTKMNYLSLYDDALSGTLPSYWPMNVSEIQQLYLSDNAISGTLPVRQLVPRLQEENGLQILILSNNQFELPSSLDLHALAHACSGRLCKGVPPHSCSAFGNARLSMSNPYKCVRCRLQPDTLFALLAFSASIASLLLVIFVGTMLQHPEMLERSLSTVAIGVQNAQAIALMGRLHLRLPPTFAHVAQMLSEIFTLGVHAGCLMEGRERDAANIAATSSGEDRIFWAFSYIFCGVALALFLSSLLAELALHCCRWRRSADGAVAALSVTFTLLLIVSLQATSAIFVAAAAPQEEPAGFPFRAVPAHIELIRAFQKAQHIQRVRRNALVTGGITLASALLAVQLGVLLRFVLALRTYQLLHLQGWPLQQPPRHALRWQLVLWARQAALLLICIACGIFLQNAADKQVVTYTSTALSLLVVLASLVCQCRFQPFIYDQQNKLEEMLLCLHGLLLALGWASDGIARSAAHATPLSSALEALMLLLLFGGMLGSFVWLLGDLRDAKLDLGRRLDKIGAAIDEPVHERLLAGDVRLLRCSWLMDHEASNAAFDRDERGTPIIRRLQDLPDAAFASPAEAEALYSAGERKVLVLSHGWQTPGHCDPHGTTLERVRAFLATKAAAHSECLLFWDMASLPQRPRTANLNASFRRALKEMGSFYASIASTAVIQVKHMPDPAQLPKAACVTVSNLPESATEADVRAALSGYPACNLIELSWEDEEVLPGETPERKNGRYIARFASHEQACEVVKELKTARPPALAGAGIFPYYNSRPYDERGWCVFEQGAASVVLAHFEEAERQGRTLPARLAAAQAARRKVIEVSDDGTPKKLEHGGVAPDLRGVAPDLLLDDVTDKLRDEGGDVRFTGTGDRAMVCELLTKFEWTIHTSLSMGVNLTESARRVLARPATGWCWPILRYASLNRVEAVREVQLGADTNA
ncbi:hypothetical protein EMIHUDRAFT_242059 [Emiliania huxleyi CCMP1516]|uniref:RRM domain-containing protein n=2 Tax=Emiliania huxleyi TaxID=2903 RepID=A0A0D3JA51_EMIH1|nr:hypothetical protein EMIHUDRAFT_242059 [Emiliania huxleyi CCMP1516]EOD20386.1 hypothetical protein EMIHUDRAFT_242059 [Emiliania huxleyi CCMP1516]|eukprot:XP_005772815.1 hypothetical protein EMIHUDRAFT_242059 [Emiliania huxleyi CCMP1516]